MCLEPQVRVRDKIIYGLRFGNLIRSIIFHPLHTSRSFSVSNFCRLLTCATPTTILEGFTLVEHPARTFVLYNIDVVCPAECIVRAANKRQYIYIYSYYIL